MDRKARSKRWIILAWRRRDGATLDVPGSPGGGEWPALAGVPISTVEPITGFTSSATPLTGLAPGGTITWDVPAMAFDTSLYVILRVGTFESSDSGSDTDWRTRLVCATADDGTTPGRPDHHRHRG